jgi:hypothetical protein
MSTQSKGQKIGYLVTTGLIVFSQGVSGIGDFMGAEMVVEGMSGLGFPLYVLYILGFWKIAGVITLAAPGNALTRLREWAYAGFFFDFTGAAASHALNGDGPDLIMPPLVLLAILLASYYLLPANRKP